MILNRSTYISLVFLVFAAANVNAQSSSTDKQWLLSKYDVNSDRAISIDEVEVERKKAFSKMDFDRDGDVSFDEYALLDKSRRSPILKARFDRLDSDQDGILSNAEYASYLGSFERLDQNGDGHVSQQEMAIKNKSKREELKENADACLLWFCVRKNMW